MAKSADAFRTISEVAEILSVPAHVLRFWESRFSQVKPVKRAGGRRYYRPQDIRLLSGIRTLLHDDGMTIKGVQKILREQGVQHVAAKGPALPDMQPDTPASDARDAAPAGAEVLGFAPTREASGAARETAEAPGADPLPEDDPGEDPVTDPVTHDSPAPAPPSPEGDAAAPPPRPQERTRRAEPTSSADDTASPQPQPDPSTTPRSPTPAALPPLPDLPDDPSDKAPAQPGALAALAGLPVPVPPETATRLSAIAGRLRELDRDNRPPDAGGT